MRYRNRSRAGQVFGLAGQPEAFTLENLEQRQLLAADLAGIRLVLNAAGAAAEVRQWTGEHDTIDDGGPSDPVTFDLTVNEQRLAGMSDFDGPNSTNWAEFELFPTGKLGINYTSGSPFNIGSSFESGEGFDLGWFIEGRDGNQQSISFLHELATDISIPDMNGNWTYASIAIPTSGSRLGNTIEGAYGTVSVVDLLGNLTWTAETIGGKENGTGSIMSLAANGLGQFDDAEYFAVSADGNFFTAVDLSYGDGMTYFTVAMRRGATITAREVAGEYRFGAALTGDAAQRRTGDLVAFESVYLKLQGDGTLVALDLEDFDNGTETVVHTGQWNLLPDGRSVLITYEDIDEAHLVGFGIDKTTFIDLRVNHDGGNSYVIGQGERVADDDSGTSEDDHANDGEYNIATPISLTESGGGTASGDIEIETDTDLFTFTTPVEGRMSINLTAPQGTLSGVLTLKDADGNVLESAAVQQSSFSVTLNWEVTADTTYFLVVGAKDEASNGAYSIVITTETSGGGGGGDDYVDDYGQDDDGSDDVLTDPDDIPFPHFILPGRAPTGRQAVWEFGTDNAWHYSKLGLRTETPGIIGELVTWRDEGTNAFMVAAATENGMILWVRDEDTGMYTKRDLTEEAGDDGEIPAAPATWFTLSDGRNALASLNADGDVIVYVESQGSTFMVNLSQTEIRDQDKTIPALHGKLTAGISAWGTTIIAGLDADGKVWTVWFSETRPQDRWNASPLSKIAKAQPIAGNLSMYFTSWNGINVAGLGEDGQTRVIWWVPRFKGKWEVVNLARKFEGPTFKANSMTTYATPWDALTVVGITDANRMVAYWWAPGFKEWAISDFSEVLPNNNPRVIRGPIHYELRANNNIWLFGRDAEDQMVRVVWSRAADSWRSNIINIGADQF